jgi:hypothetical protein
VESWRELEAIEIRNEIPAKLSKFSSEPSNPLQNLRIFSKTFKSSPDSSNLFNIKPSLLAFKTIPHTDSFHIQIHLTNLIQYSAHPQLPLCLPATYQFFLLSPTASQTMDFDIGFKVLCVLDVFSVLFIAVVTYLYPTLHLLQLQLWN